MKEHLYHARTTGKIYRHQDMPAILGYRGFLVHPPQAEEAELVVGQETKELQKLLLETMPEELISQALRQKILQPRWNQQAFLIVQVHILVNPKRLLSKRWRRLPEKDIKLRKYNIMHLNSTWIGGTPMILSDRTTTATITQITKSPTALHSLVQPVVILMVHWLQRSCFKLPKAMA